MLISNTTGPRWNSVIGATLSVLITAFSGATAAEQDATFPVAFAAMLRGSPISGTVLCKATVQCRILYRADPRLSLSVTREARNSYTLDIDCFDCSFSGGRTRVYASEEREFEIQYGRADGIVKNLVMQRRTQFGSVYIAFPTDDRWPR